MNSNEDIKKLVRKQIKDNKVITLTTVGIINDLKPIGEGGNALVYSGKIHNQEIALKLLCTNKEDKKTRFLAEYFNIQKIPNKNIITYFNLDTTNIETQNILVIVMKKYNRSLTEHNKEINKKNFNQLLNFLLDSIKHIHSQGVIHRDIKPENILIDEQEHYILSDFGIAGYNEDYSLQHNTASGERLGNRQFSAPEQEKKGVDPHQTMDIYALGQILYRFATGGDRISGSGHKKISSIIDDLQLGIDKVISICTQINPNNRFQSIQEIRDFIKSKREPTPRECITLFDELIRSSFPQKDNHGISYTNSKNRIDYFFNKLAENSKSFSHHLRYQIPETEYNFCGNYYFHPRKVQGLRKFVGGNYTTESGTKGHAYDIKEMRTYRSNSYEMKDFTLIHFNKSEPIKINGTEEYGYYLIENNHIVTFSEGDEGYAEIGDKIYNLSEHYGEFIQLNNKEGYLFIAPFFNTICYREYEQRLVELIKNIINEGADVTNEIIGKFGDNLSIDPIRYDARGIQI